MKTVLVRSKMETGTMLWRDGIESSLLSTLGMFWFSEREEMKRKGAPEGSLESKTWR